LIWCSRGLFWGQNCMLWALSWASRPRTGVH
jgi:hypothetical protein